MIAKLLHESGLYLGEAADLMPATEDGSSRRTLGKHLKFVNINDEVLDEFGGGWDCAAIPPPAEYGPHVTEIAAQAAALVGQFAAASLGGGGTRATAHPALLAASDWAAQGRACGTESDSMSSSRCDGAISSSFALGLDLWKEDTNGSDLTRPEDLLVTHYDAYFERGVDELERLLAFIGLAPGEREHEGVIGRCHPAPAFSVHLSGLLPRRDLRA